MRRAPPQRRPAARAASLATRLAALLRSPLDPVLSWSIAGVIAVALATAFVAAWTSASASDDFLRAEAMLRFPTLLAAAGDRAEFWRAQRRLDVRAVARSARLRDAVSALRGGGPEASRDAGAVRALLAEALASSHAVRAFWLMDAAGGRLAGAGERWAADPEIRALAARAPDSRWSDARGRLLVAEPCEGAVLIAAVSPAGLSAELASLPIGPESLYVASAGGSVIARAGTRDARGPSTPLPLSRERPVVVREVARADGSILVRGARLHPETGWIFVVEAPQVAVVAPAAAFARRILAVNLALAGIFVGVALWLSRASRSPKRSLYRDARRIAGLAGPGDDVAVLARAFYELRTRARRTRHQLREKQREVALANERLQAQNEDLQRANDVLARLSITDDLTRLHNHRFFRDSLPRELKRALRSGSPLSLVLFDIDDFKRLNDRCGHAVGDAILFRVAAVMKSAVREVDLLARYGGEEFALLAPGTPPLGAVALAEKIRLTVANARFSVLGLDGPQSLQVTISAGVAGFHGDERELFHDADRALYRAKASGKDCVMLADAD